MSYCHVSEQSVVCSNARLWVCVPVLKPFVLTTVTQESESGGFQCELFGGTIHHYPLIDMKTRTHTQNVPDSQKKIVLHLNVIFLKTCWMLIKNYQIWQEKTASSVFFQFSLFEGQQFDITGGIGYCFCVDITVKVARRWRFKRKTPDQDAVEHITGWKDKPFLEAKFMNAYNSEPFI